MEHRHDHRHELAAPHFANRISLDDAQAIVDITANEQVHFDALLHALEGRDALAGLYWRRATSIGVGIQNVRSLRHALAILGLQRIRAIALMVRDQALDEVTSRAV